jgi:hypothetical protein
METLEKLKIFSKIKVSVFGIEFETIIDEHRTQRFIANELVWSLVNAGVIDVNQVEKNYLDKKFSQKELILFYIALGYSLERMSYKFPDLEIKKIY